MCNVAQIFDKEFTMDDELKLNLAENLKAFCNEKYYEEAADLSHDEIIQRYGDEPVAIAEIRADDPIFKGIWKDARSNLVYTGLGSFINHWVNHHPEMDSSDFLKIQEVLENPDARYLEKAKNAVVFDKRIGELHDVVILKKAADKLIYERSNYLPKKLPKRWIPISAENGLPIEKSSFVDGHPTISQSDDSEAGIVRNISTLNDDSNILQSAEKSSEILEMPMSVTVNGKARTCEHGIRQGFVNAVKRIDELHDENKMLREENDMLQKLVNRNKIQSQDTEYEF